MFRFETVPYDPSWWNATLHQFSDRGIFQSPAWLGFVAETQRGKIVTAALRDGDATVGYFSGLVVRKFGLSLLGSPLPGWTTSYMGFNLADGVPRMQAFEALRVFAFRELGCAHLEVMDRHLDCRSVRAQGFSFRDFQGFEIDLEPDENTLFSRLNKNGRYAVRKATRSGVSVEESQSEDFAIEYYAQLQDVFGKQRLAPTYGVQRVAALLHHLLPTGNLLLLRARDSEGRSIATMICVAMHQRAFLWGTASWRPFQSLLPNEMLFWHAILRLKARGIRFFDLGGGGEYKRKYGGDRISVPWVHTSRYPFLPAFRSALATASRMRQRLVWKSKASLALTITSGTDPR
jgi:CelD/BcsL family acetyltransferase involved in cellulose biosynthesis